MLKRLMIVIGVVIAIILLPYWLGIITLPSFRSFLIWVGFNGVNFNFSHVDLWTIGLLIFASLSIVAIILKLVFIYICYDE